jgi:toxin ParE1/3/4
MPVLEIKILPLARRELKSIGVFTASKWGADQAKRYLQSLDREIQRLSSHPELGTPCEDIRTGYRYLHIHRHLVFYRTTGDQIEIVRVLHDAMDAVAPLRKSES